MADYAGDVTPQQAWDLLKAEPNAVLVDCRTKAEWNYVGVPDLSTIGKACIFSEWVSFPGGQPNPNFVIEVRAAATDPEAPILFLCRSGVRSKGGAAALTRAGYERCYNVLEGFEGDMDGARHRGATGGWKVAGLPWVQT